MMHNIKMVCGYLGKTCNCPEFLFCGEKNYIIFNDEIWRVYRYIENSVSYSILEDNSKIREFGRVLGNFHNSLENANISDFYMTMNDFHNPLQRIKRLLELKNIGFDKYFDFFYGTLGYAEKLNSKNIPFSIVHNDVKCSNVLFDISSGKGLTLIDFDTVMPGRRIYDFGDGARSACISDNRIDLNKFDAYCGGYFSVISDAKDCEEDYFLASLCIASELAARYFYDFLSKENYFSDKTAEEKLHRCNELIEISESIKKYKNKMIGMIYDHKTNLCKSQ